MVVSILNQLFYEALAWVRPNLSTGGKNVHEYLPHHNTHKGVMIGDWSNLRNCLWGSAQSKIVQPLLPWTESASVKSIKVQYKWCYPPWAPRWGPWENAPTPGSDPNTNNAQAPLLCHGSLKTPHYLSKIYWLQAWVLHLPYHSLWYPH